MQFYTEASDIQIWRTVDNSSDFSENKYSTTKVYQLTIAISYRHIGCCRQK